MEKQYLVIRKWDTSEPSLVISKMKDLPAYMREHKGSEVRVYNLDMKKIEDALEEVEFSVTIKQK